MGVISRISFEKRSDGRCVLDSIRFGKTYTVSDDWAPDGKPGGNVVVGIMLVIRKCGLEDIERSQGRT